MTGPACSPATAAAAYWESVPHAVIWPVVVLATAAAIIASQALITGAFSIVQQASLADNCSCTADSLPVQAVQYWLRPPGPPSLRAAIGCAPTHLPDCLS